MQVIGSDVCLLTIFCSTGHLSKLRNSLIKLICLLPLCLKGTSCVGDSLILRNFSLLFQFLDLLFAARFGSGRVRRLLIERVTNLLRENILECIIRSLQRCLLFSSRCHKVSIQLGLSEQKVELALISQAFLLFLLFLNGLTFFLGLGGSYGFGSLFSLLFFLLLFDLEFLVLGSLLLLIALLFLLFTWILLFRSRFGFCLCCCGGDGACCSGRRPSGSCSRSLLFVDSH
mmetsp:Transcript_11550/g.43346  ORF Transcript_11550/g.43346 Transcript_11550/m.43346 type:complete len:230 (+) Transcript_11550:3373-4062(+)